jgi:hypothetical protein
MPVLRKKNRTARCPSEEVRHVGETEQIRSGRTERKPTDGRLGLVTHHHETPWCLMGKQKWRTGGEEERG